MSYKFLIKKGEWEPLLEIKVQEEILEQDPLIHSFLERCFERVFQLIRKERNESVNEENLERDDSE